MNIVDYELGLVTREGDEYSEATGATVLRANCKLKCNLKSKKVKKGEKISRRAACNRACDEQFEKRIRTGSLFGADKIEKQNEIIEEETEALEEELRLEEERLAEEERQAAMESTRSGATWGGSTSGGSSSGSTSGDSEEGGMSNALKYGLIGGGALILIVGIALVAKKK